MGAVRFSSAFLQHVQMFVAHLEIYCTRLLIRRVTLPKNKGPATIKGDDEKWPLGPSENLVTGQGANVTGRERERESGWHVGTGTAYQPPDHLEITKPIRHHRPRLCLKLFGFSNVRRSYYNSFFGCFDGPQKIEDFHRNVFQTFPFLSRKIECDSVMWYATC